MLRVFSDLGWEILQGTVLHMQLSGSDGMAGMEVFSQMACKDLGGKRESFIKQKNKIRAHYHFRACLSRFFDPANRALMPIASPLVNEGIAEE